MSPVAKSVELSNHLILPYVEQGDTLGLPALFLHGVTDSWHSFEPVLPHLPPAIHAFAITQRGHGDAGRPQSNYRYHDLAADLVAFMDALNIRAAIIAGHSMGSSVAQRLAIDHPERTLGLVLFGAFSGRISEPGAREFCASVATLTDPVDPGFVREFQQSTLAQPVPESFFETVVHESLKVPARVWKTLFEGFLTDDFSGELGSIVAPTLIIWGDQDAFCSRADQEILTSAIAGSRLVVYKGAGHAVHWEEPERFAADLVAFAKGLGG